MVFTQFTVFHVLYFGLLLIGSMVGLHLGESLGGWWSWGALALGMACGHLLGIMPLRWAGSAMMKEIESASNEALRAILEQPGWNFYQTMALLQLAARHQQVRDKLPRIIHMLESEDELERVYGWDALRLVFDDEYHVIEDYEPREPLDACRSKLERLKALLDLA